MLKMMGKGKTESGKPVTLVLFGLSYKNLDKLKEGLPIKFNGATAGLSDEYEFLIFAGETEQTMARDVAAHVGPETEVKIDPRLKD